MKHFALALLATTALAAPAQAADVYGLFGPIMHDPSPGQIAERCDYYLNQIDLRRDALAGDADAATVPNTLERFDDIVALSQGAGGEMELYQQVLATPEARAAGGECSVRIASLNSEIGLSRPIFERLSALDASAEDRVVQDYLAETLATFRRSGVALDDAGRARVQEINGELAEITTVFARNIAEDVRTIEVSPAELAGLPDDFITSREVGANGMITLTTASTDYQPVMTYADSDDLRRRYSELYGQRAYPMNEEPLRRMFTLRQELATLTGYPNYAAWQFENRMLNTPEQVTDLIATTVEAARPVAEADYAQTLAVLQTIDPAATRIEPWQVGWLSPKVQQANYDFDPQEARQYFAYDNVRDGIFALTQRLFGVEVRAWDTPLWHESVEAFELVENGAVIGRFYLDSHPRPGKYTHANVVPLYPGDPDGGVPVAALVQNLPRGDHSTGLMEHGQVETFLHEFGHILHVMFGNAHEYTGSGVFGVEWDFIEAPSQMLENWVYDYDTLATFAVNAEGETIPRDLVERMNRARYFNQGMGEMTQLGLSNVSLNFYTRPVPADLGAATRQWRNEYSLIPVSETSQMQTSFGHLDGYGAAYYTYGWSRVISTDLFSRFLAEGITNPETASDYRTLILAPGGTKPAAELVRDFLGRDISLDAFRAELERGLPEE
ncbi:MAG: Zn-dependent oligopeptidase [Erythrobacter sp.]|nr:MAG: Zn-dependent oligopeptidase [Erythrobacter sp.]